MIHPTDLGNAEVSNLNTGVDNGLREQYKWKGHPLSAVGITLSAPLLVVAPFLTKIASR
jgi:hypothetical protein